MIETRWSGETKMLVRRHIASACAAIASAPGAASPYDISIERAKRLLSALADAGLLLPPRADRAHPDDWPAAAEGIATRAIREALPDITPSGPNLIARRIMADLVSADLLAVPGETAQQWGYRLRGEEPVWGQSYQRERALDKLQAWNAARPDQAAVLVARTVHTGPWREVQS